MTHRTPEEVMRRTEAILPWSMFVLGLLVGVIFMALMVVLP